MIGSHVIPRRYLRWFANNDERICVYAKDRQPRWSSPASEAKENGYFGYVTGEGEFNEELEEKLARIEDELSPSVELLRSPLFAWSPWHHSRVVEYVALMHSRNWSRRKATERVATMTSTLLRDAANDTAFLNEMAERYTNESGRYIGADGVRTAIERTAAENETTKEHARTFVSRLALNVRVTAASIGTKSVQIWDAPDETCFITSDTPVVTGLPVGDNFAPGFGFNRAFVFFPISPRSCAVFGPAGYWRRTATEHQVRCVNELVAGSAQRFAYADRNSSGIKELVDEFAGTIRFGENAFLPSKPLPDAREFIRKQGRN